MESDTGINLELIKEKIELWAIRLGYIKYTKDFIYATKFNDDFSNYCDSLDLELSQESGRAVLSEIIHGKRRLVDVGSYLLIIKFLAGSIDKLFSNSAKVMPTEKNWPCKNPLCTFYEKDVIQSSNINLYKDQNSGNFTCPHCEMRYIANWDHSLKILNYKIVWYGREWNQNVYKIYIDNQMNARKTARVIGVSPQNIYFVLKVIKHNSEKLEVVCDSQDRDTLLNNMKEKLYSFLKENPNATRTDIRNIVGRGLCKRLREMDMEWLEGVLPLQKNRVNCAKLDEIILPRLFAIIEELYSNPPSRIIKKSTILGKLTKSECNKLTKYYLPKSIELISKSIESKEHYQLRLIDHYIGQLKKHCYSRPTLQNMLNVNAYKDCSDLVINAIKKRLGEYGFD